MKVISNICGIFSGVLAVIFAFVIKGMSTGSSMEVQAAETTTKVTAASGGDASYVDLQNSIAQVANNVQALTKLVQMGFLALLLILGIAIACYFISQMNDKMAGDISEKVKKVSKEAASKATAATQTVGKAATEKVNAGKEMVSKAVNSKKTESVVVEETAKEENTNE